MSLVKKIWDHTNSLNDSLFTARSISKLYRFYESTPIEKFAAVAGVFTHGVVKPVGRGILLGVGAGALYPEYNNLLAFSGVVLGTASSILVNTKADKMAEDFSYNNNVVSSYKDHAKKFEALGITTGEHNESWTKSFESS